MKAHGEWRECHSEEKSKKKRKTPNKLWWKQSQFHHYIYVFLFGSRIVPAPGLRCIHCSISKNGFCCAHHDCDVMMRCPYPTHHPFLVGCGWFRYNKSGIYDISASRWLNWTAWDKQSQCYRFSSSSHREAPNKCPFAQPTYTQPAPSRIIAYCGGHNIRATVRPNCIKREIRRLLKESPARLSHQCNTVRRMRIHLFIYYL